LIPLIFPRSKQYNEVKDEIYIVDNKHFPDRNEEGEIIGDFETEEIHKFNFRARKICRFS